MKPSATVPSRFDVWDKAFLFYGWALKMGYLDPSLRTVAVKDS